MEEIKSCIFCNFEKRYIITETNYSFATYFPRAIIKKGHLVVAVKEHIPTFTGLSMEQCSDISQLSLRLAKKAEKIINAEKYYLVAIADNDLHFHIHLLPKLTGHLPMGRHNMMDEGWKGEVGQTVSEEEEMEFIKVLRT